MPELVTVSASYFQYPVSSEQTVFNVVDVRDLEGMIVPGLVSLDLDFLDFNTDLKICYRFNYFFNKAVLSIHARKPIPRSLFKSVTSCVALICKHANKANMLIGTFRVLKFLGYASPSVSIQLAKLRIIGKFDRIELIWGVRWILRDQKVEYNLERYGLLLGILVDLANSPRLIRLAAQRSLLGISPIR